MRSLSHINDNSCYILSKAPTAVLTIQQHSGNTEMLKRFQSFAAHLSHRRLHLLTLRIKTSVRQDNWLTIWALIDWDINNLFAFGTWFVVDKAVKFALGEVTGVLGLSNIFIGQKLLLQVQALLLNIVIRTTFSWFTFTFPTRADGVLVSRHERNISLICSATNHLATRSNLFICLLTY